MFSIERKFANNTKKNEEPTTQYSKIEEKKMHREKLLFISVACIIAFSLPLRGKSEKYNNNLTQFQEIKWYKSEREY